MAPTEHSHALDTILHQITSTTNIAQLNHFIRNNLGKDSREMVLAGPLSSGQDPLSILDVQTNTLGMLWILSSRFLVNGCALPSPDLLAEFCERFVPEQARFAPERVTLLAKGIVYIAENMQDPTWAITPLYNLLKRYAYPSFLTTIHTIFLKQCCSTWRFVEALPILSIPITDIDTSLSDLTYNDNIIYHYLGGIAYAALKKWPEAEEFFEISMTSPGSAASAVQFEALKKLKLVQLISKGKTTPPPKYIHPHLPRLFKHTPYHVFVLAYPQNTEQMRSIYEREKAYFHNDKNLGLLTQALERAPRWALKKLTATYLTLSLADIGKAVKIESEDDVRDLVLSMIESKDIDAKISADGSVTFFDPLPEFTKEQVDNVLRDVQEQAMALQNLDLEVGRSREFLTKAVRSKDDFGTAGEEESYGLFSAPPSGWADEQSMYS